MTEFTTVTNLNAAATAGDTFSTSFQLIDTLGSTHIATINYTKTTPGHWSYDITVGRLGRSTGGTAGTPKSILSAPQPDRLRQHTGVPTPVNNVTPPANVAIPVRPGRTAQPAPTSRGTSCSPTVAAALTGFTSPSGNVADQCERFDRRQHLVDQHDKTGQVIASFGAGKTKIVVAQLALASFNNPQGLTKVGSKLLRFLARPASRNIGAGHHRRSRFDHRQRTRAVERRHPREFTQMIPAARLSGKRQEHHRRRRNSESDNLNPSANSHVGSHIIPDGAAIAAPAPQTPVSSGSR